MFHSKPQRPSTIADAIAQKKLVVFTCKACGAITSKEPSDLLLKPKLELTALEAVSVCPQCGAGNVTGKSKQLLLAILD